MKLSQGTRWMGDYEALTNYVKYDIISYENSTYICIQDSVGNEPTNLAYWEPMAIGVVNQGTYSNSTQYLENDIIAYNNESYIAIEPVLGEDPSTSAKWMLLGNSSKHRGYWDSLTQYYKNDIVSFENGTYLAKTDNLNIEPGTTADWETIATSVNYRGPWGSANDYIVNDIVRRAGASYICILSHTNQDPNDSPTYWQVFTEKGDPGVGLTFKGAYSDTYAYVAEDLVLYGNSLYECILANTGNLPTNLTYWRLFLSGEGVQVSEVAPTNPADKQLWVDLTD
jgi:hypothetical protein